MPTSDVVLAVAGLALGITGGATLMRARAHALPEFQDRAAASFGLPRFEWYTPEGQRLLRRGVLLQGAAVVVWLNAAAT